MKNTKRIVITSVVGLASGAAVAALVNLALRDNPLPPEVIWRMILVYGLMGFTIGTSSLKWPWALHGLALGGVFGVLEGLATLAAGGPLFLPLVFGCIAGFLVEMVASVAFKARPSVAVSPSLGTHG